MTLKIKNTLLLICLINCFSVFSQSVSKDNAVSGLTGKWRLEYKNENMKDDTLCLVSKRIIALKKQKGKEIGYFKDGQTITNAIKWDFVNSEDKNKLVIVFNGGIWVNQQEFILVEIMENKITMLSCDKDDNCNEAYLIRE